MTSTRSGTSSHALADLQQIVQEIAQEVEQNMRDWLLTTAAITSEYDTWDLVKLWADRLAALSGSLPTPEIEQRALNHDATPGPLVILQRIAKRAGKRHTLTLSTIDLDEIRASVAAGERVIEMMNQAVEEMRLDPPSRSLPTTQEEP